MTNELGGWETEEEMARMKAKGREIGVQKVSSKRSKREESFLHAGIFF